MPASRTITGRLSKVLPVTDLRGEIVWFSAVRGGILSSLGVAVLGLASSYIPSDARHCPQSAALAGWSGCTFAKYRRENTAIYCCNPHPCTPPKPWRSGLPGLAVTEVADVNHYTIVMGARGYAVTAAAVATAGGASDARGPVRSPVMYE